MSKIRYKAGAQRYTIDDTYEQNFSDHQHEDLMQAGLYAAAWAMKLNCCLGADNYPWMPVIKEIICNE